MSGAVPPLPNTLPWRGAQLKHRHNFTFTFYGYQYDGQEYTNFRENWYEDHAPGRHHALGIINSLSVLVPTMRKQEVSRRNRNSAI
jgi:hypothetical protein